MLREQSAQLETPVGEEAPTEQVSLRMRWLYESATMTLPLLSTDTPQGE